jgi:cytochrome c oxidase subunit I+III
MPRRVYTYQPEMGWQALNLLVTSGALVFFVSFVMLLWNMVSSLRSGEMAGANPWDGPSLEWATPSPPPPQNFDRIPLVTGHTPLWEHRESLPSVGGLATRMRQLIVTTVGEAVPLLRSSSPAPSMAPLFAALGTTIAFIGSIFTPWAIVWGSALAGVPMIVWFWPKGEPEDEL